MDTEKIAAMKFEEALAALEQATQQLESGDLSLADAISTYEYSVALATHCDSLLEGAELRVRKLNEADNSVRQEELF